MTPTDKILSLALRPRQLEYLVGQKKVVTALRTLMSTRPPSALLLHGSPGVGKTSLARIIAVSLQCTHQQLWGQPCAACWAAWGEFAIHEINASEANGVDEIGELAKLSRFDPMPPSKKRVFILDEAQNISSAAQNLLLKHFEDPAPNTVWVIASTAPNKIIAALQRRCVSYALEGMNTPERVQVLLKRAAKHIAFTKPFELLVKELAQAEITSPALILMAFEQFVTGQTPVDAVAAVRNTTGGKTDTFAICKAVSNGKWNDVRMHLRDATPEESRYIRASVVGWLKGWLLKEQDRAKADKVSIALRDLLGVAPLDDPLLFPWLIATLYKVCRTLG